MKPKILYILTSYNIYGGTPKKILDLMKYFGENSSLYVYHDIHQENKRLFEDTGASVYEGFFGWNLFKHVKKLIKIVDKEEIDIIQTQFSMGEILGYFVKLFRPKVKLIVSFEGPFKPSGVKTGLSRIIYRKVDSIAYVSDYVRNEKIEQFPTLKNKEGQIIYNGTQKREDTGEEVISMNKIAILDIAGLIEFKNIQVLIEALNILLKKRNKDDIFLYVAGDGPKKNELQTLVERYNLEEHVFLLGYQENVGRLLNKCDIFAHPAYAEGFGIAVAEAMMAKKPIIVSNAGALPELIDSGQTGLIVDSNNADQWAAAILKLIADREFAKKISKNAKDEAERRFSVEEYRKNYEELYQNLITTCE